MKFDFLDSGVIDTLHACGPVSTGASRGIRPNPTASHGASRMATRCHARGDDLRKTPCLKQRPHACLVFDSWYVVWLTTRYDRLGASPMVTNAFPIGTQGEALMIRNYIDAALRQAHYEIIDDEEPYYGSVPALQGVWASGRTLEECRDRLADVIEGWVLIRLSRGLTIPPIGDAEVTAP